MKLETDPQKSDILKWDDVESGRLLYNLKKLNVQFPSGLTIDKVGKLNGELFIAGDKDSVKLVATMPIDTTFLTTTDKAPNGEKPYVAILAISNPDNTIGFLSVMLNNADELSLFTKMLQSNGTNDLVFFIQKSTTLDIKNKNDAKWWPSFRLYETENRLKMSKGELQIVTVLNDVLSTGKFGDETSRIIVSATVVK